MSIWIKLGAVAAFILAVAGGIWWTYEEGKSTGKTEIQAKTTEKALEKTNEGTRLRHEAERRAVTDSDDDAFERMRPRR